MLLSLLRGEFHDTNMWPRKSAHLRAAGKGRLRKRPGSRNPLTEHASSNPIPFYLDSFPKRLCHFPLALQSAAFGGHLNSQPYDRLVSEKGHGDTGDSSTGPFLKCSVVCSEWQEEISQLVSTTLYLFCWTAGSQTVSTASPTWSLGCVLGPAGPHCLMLLWISTWDAAIISKITKLT